METCTQCGIRAVQHPVVAIMNQDDVEASDYAKLEDAIELADSNGTPWAAMPVCAACHQAPTLKAHFHFRKDYKSGLQHAGSNNLGGGN